MNLGEFHLRVKKAINRGDAHDAVIPLWVADAARLIEQNYDFSWMFGIETFTVDSIGAGSNEIDLASTFVKKVLWLKMVRGVSSGEQWIELAGVDPQQVISIDQGALPSAYWLEGDQMIVLDSVPSENLTYKVRVVKYTDWPLSDAATPSLLAKGQMALFVETMIQFATERRDPTMLQTWNDRRTQAYSTLLRSEQEFQNAHQTDQRMEYTGLYR